MNKRKLKVLIPVDGSEQAHHAVNYAARVFPSDRTKMVLFHVDVQNPDLGKSLSGNPMYNNQMKNIDKWMAANHNTMNRFMEKAVACLMDQAFPRSAIEVKIKNKNVRVTDEIINEARDEYAAVVVGKTGTSRLKDRFVGSLAMKLAGKLNYIPLIIVAGDPLPYKILLSVDRREEAFRSINCIAALLDIQKFNIAISHIARCELTQKGFHRKSTSDGEKYMCPLRDVECICPSIDSMKKCLVEEGILSDHLTDMVVEDKNAVAATLALIRSKKFGSIVVGRRTIVPFVEELVSGRYSQKILKKMEDMALWVVN
ncbi:MAG: universal stress protein [Dissulfuribacterales bacterium]